VHWHREIACIGTGRLRALAQGDCVHWRDMPCMLTRMKQRTVSGAFLMSVVLRSRNNLVVKFKC